MKRIGFASFFLCLTAVFLLSQSNPVSLANQTPSVVAPSAVPSNGASPADAKAQARILDSYGKLPLNFEANRGQADARVKFLSRTGGYSLFLTGDEAILALNGKKAQKNSPASSLVSGHRFSDAVSSAKSKAPLGAGRRDGLPNESTPGGVLRMKLRHANPAARVTGTDELAGTSNYFIGNDPAKWRTKVPTYAKVKYEGIYSGIDLVYYGNQRQLEYDFIVAPGADPRRIAFEVSGAKWMRRDAQGELVFKLKTGEDEIRWHKPVVYQEKDGARQEIAASYAITAANRVTFELAKYDASKPLYIDPLIYSTYLGGSSADEASGIAMDSSGYAYVTGWIGSTDFPVTPGAFQTTCGSCYYYDTVDTVGTAFVTKINPTGSALVYSTYLGGSGGDAGTGIAVDSTGNTYVTGQTTSSDFPVTPGAFQTTISGGRNAFVTEINPTGSALVYSTYLGGSGGDSGSSIAVDSAGNVYVTGAAGTGFPVTPGAFQATYSGIGDAFS